jgi:hypothetical protein
MVGGRKAKFEAIRGLRIDFRREGGWWGYLYLEEIGWF